MTLRFNAIATSTHWCSHIVAVYNILVPDKALYNYVVWQTQQLLPIGLM